MLLVNILKHLAFALRGDLVGYTGATTLPSDARAVFTRWRRGDRLRNGPYIREFEDALSTYHGGAEAITFGAGRMALYAILKAMNLQPGDEIILPGYTCVVTSNAVRFAGLKPVYVDVSADDFNMVPSLIEEGITAKTRAIVAQHTFGIPCDIDALQDISKRSGIPIIEDGAHAIGARLNGRIIGIFGHAAFFSTQLTKMFSTERGGYVVTRDSALAGKVRAVQEACAFRSEESERASLLRWCYYALLRNPRLTGAQQFANRAVKRFPRGCALLQYDWEDYGKAVAGVRSSPYPCRLANLMAYAGLRQLARLEDDLAHRRKLAAYLEGRLPDLGVRVPRYSREHAAPSWVRFPFVVNDRETWMPAMRLAGLTPGVWLNDPIHPEGCDWCKAEYVRGSCPNAEYLSKHVLNVPVDTRVTVARLRRWLDRCRRLKLT